MPSHKTFSIKPIKEFINKNLGWDFIDPFPFPYKQDAIEYLKTIPSNTIYRLIFDPPYSQRQLKEMYESKGISFNHKMDNSYCEDILSDKIISQEIIEPTENSDIRTVIII